MGSEDNNTMTLDQAIEHARETGDRLSNECENRECGLEHIQLANWLQELKDTRSKYMYLAADFDNYKKRMNRERAEWINGASRDILMDLLDVVDDYERLLKNVKEDDSNASGIRMVYEKLTKLLDNEGCVKIRINAGDDYDADMMDAISTIVPDETTVNGMGEDDTIAYVAKEGYMLNGKILRHPQVVVYDDVRG